MTGPFRIFVETPAGSREKLVYDEASLELLDRIPVSTPYPYAYGFLPDHMGADGECVDCYLITDAPLAAGSVIEGRVVGLVEQWEAGAEDHKVLVVPLDAPPELPAGVADDLMAFMRALFADFPDMLVTVGPERSARSALQYLTSWGPPPPA